MIAAAFSIWISADQRIALGVFKGWILVPIFYFIMWSDINDDHFFLRIGMRSFFLSATLLSIWGLNQVFTGDFLTIDERASGPFESANYLAMYIGPAVVGLAILIIKRLSAFSQRIGHEMWMVVVQFLLCGAALYFTQSYAALLAVIAAIILYLMLRFGVSLLNYWGRSLIIASFVVGLFVVLAFGQSSTQKFDKFSNFLNFNERSSSSVRLEIWHVASHYLSIAPIEGIGLWQFQQSYEQDAARILDKQPYEQTALHPHNVFITTWLSTGLLGLFAFLWIIYAALQRINLAPKHAMSYVRIGVVLLLVIVLHGFFDTTFWKNDLAYLFWFAVGLARA